MTASGIGTWPLIRVLVKLRHRLTFATMGSGSRVLYIVLGAATAVAALLIGGYVATRRGNPLAADLLALIGLVSTIGWTVGATALGSSQYSLDPRKLLTLPIDDRQLMLGFLVSSTLTLPSAATMILALAALGHTPSFTGALLLFPAAVLQWLISLLLGRTIVAGLDRLLGGRRSRDIAVFLTAFAGITFGVAVQLFTFVPSIIDAMTDVRRIARWLPWGWTGETMALVVEGEMSLAFGWLLLSTALAGGCFGLWSRLTMRSLQVRPDNPPAKRGGSILVGPLTFLPGSLSRSPTVAVWSRALRQLRRDVRELVELAALLPLALLSAIPTLGALQGGSENVVLFCGAAGGSAAIVTMNLFGADGRNFGVDLLVAPNLSAVVWGKALSRITVIIIPVMLLVTGAAVVTGSWSRWVLGIGIAVATGTVGVAAGLQVSVRAPIPLPDTAAITGFNTEPGAVGTLPARFGFLILAGFFGAVVILVVFGLSLLNLTASYAGALTMAAIGIGVLTLSARSVTQKLNRQGPEFLATLSRKTRSS